MHTLRHTSVSTVNLHLPPPYVSADQVFKINDLKLSKVTHTQTKVHKKTFLNTHTQKFLYTNTKTTHTPLPISGFTTKVSFRFPCIFLLLLYSHTICNSLLPLNAKLNAVNCLHSFIHSHTHTYSSVLPTYLFFTNGSVLFKT